MTDNQEMILKWTRFNSQITKKKAVELIGSRYFRNADKYVGDILSGMVKSGFLKRIKPGVFNLGDRMKKDSLSENQTKLF